MKSQIDVMYVIKSLKRTVHEGTKLYKCITRDAKFSQCQGLSQHIKTIHNENKPHECTICKSKFTQKGNLKLHIASVHERKKPFKCNICNVSFTQKSQMTLTLHQFLKKKSLLNAAYAIKNLQYKEI